MKLCSSDNYYTKAPSESLTDNLNNDNLVQSHNLENCIYCLDDWVNKANLDQKWNIRHFSEGNITFFALKDAP